MIEDIINHGTCPSIEHLHFIMMQSYNNSKENGQLKKKDKKQINMLQSVDFIWIMI